MDGPENHHVKSNKPEKDNTCYLSYADFRPKKKKMAKVKRGVLLKPVGGVRMKGEGEGEVNMIEVLHMLA
jgi:hypothetical protein